MLKREVHRPLKIWPLVMITVAAIFFALGVHDCSDRYTYPPPLERP